MEHVASDEDKYKTHTGAPTRAHHKMLQFSPGRSTKLKRRHKWKRLSHAPRPPLAATVLTRRPQIADRLGSIAQSIAQGKRVTRAAPAVQTNPLYYYAHASPFALARYKGGEEAGDRVRC